MNKLFVIVLMLLSVSLFAQNSKVISAYQYFENYKETLQDNKEDVTDLLKAKEAIDLALKHVKTKEGAKTWYYKGIIESLISQSALLKGQYPDALKNAIDAYSKCLTIKKKNRHVSDALESLSSLGNHLHNDGADKFNKGDFKGSYQAFKDKLDLNEVIAKNNKSKNTVLDTVIYENAAIAASRAGMYNESAEMYEILYNKGIKTNKLMNSYATALNKAGNTSKYKMIREEARKLFPDDQGFLIDEINEMLAAGELVNAISKIEEAIKLDEKNASLRFVLGNALKEKGDFVKAADAYNKAIELKPDYFDAVFNLGTLPYNQAAEKIKVMNKLGLDQQSEYDQLKMESNNYFQQALPYFEKALTIKKDDRATLIALREIYARLENYSKVKEIKAILGE